MKIQKARKYLCVVCEEKEVVENIVEYTFEGDIPDQSNCDLSTYNDYEVTGGRLLKNRPELCWSGLKEEPAISLGGICNTCIVNNKVVQSLLPHISFASNN